MRAAVVWADKVHDKNNVKMVCDAYFHQPQHSIGPDLHRQSRAFPFPCIISSILFGMFIFTLYRETQARFHTPVDGHNYISCLQTNSIHTNPGCSASRRSISR